MFFKGFEWINLLKFKINQIVHYNVGSDIYPGMVISISSSGM